MEADEKKHDLQICHIWPSVASKSEPWRDWGLGKEHDIAWSGCGFKAQWKLDLQQGPGGLEQNQLSVSVMPLLCAMLVLQSATQTRRYRSGPDKLSPSQNLTAIPSAPSDVTARGWFSLRFHFLWRTCGFDLARD